MLRHAELLPVRCRQPHGPVETIDLYWLKTTLLNAFDSTRFLGSRAGRLRISDRHAFHAKARADAFAFRCHGEAGSFCTDRLKNATESQGPTGLAFQLLWSKEPERMRAIMAWERCVGFTELPPMKA